MTLQGILLNEKVNFNRLHTVYFHLYSILKWQSFRSGKAISGSWKLGTWSKERVGVEGKEKGGECSYESVPGRSLLYWN